MESKQLGSKDNVIKMKKSNSETIHDILEFINNEKHDQICLTDNQIEKLADVGVMLEKIFDGPRDIEWAFHKVNILHWIIVNNQKFCNLVTGRIISFTI